MKKYILSTTVILAVLIFFNGCTVTVVNRDENIQQEKETFAVDRTQVKVEKITDEVEKADDESKKPLDETALPISDTHSYIKKTKKGEATAPDGTVIATSACSYPVFKANEGDDAECIAAINKMFKDNALSVVNRVEEEYDVLIREYENSKNYGYMFIPYEYTYDFEIHANSNGIISLTETRNAYMGGAHGMAGKDSFTFDVVSGKELSITDLLYGTEEEIIDAFVQEFMKVSDEFYPGTDPAGVVPAELSKAEYYVGSEGVTAYFQEDHVGPYSSGFVSATISDKEMLKHDFS